MPQTIVMPMPEHIMTMAELKEYKALSKEIFGNAMFVVVDFTEQSHVRYNELGMKYNKLIQYWFETSALN
jgi:hypothetical protein